MLKKANTLARKISIWHFVFVLIISAAASIWLLRQNNLQMLVLRDAVTAIDTETGDINQTQPKLEELGNFVLNHMNTDMGAPLELPGAYNTAVEQVRKRVEESGSANSAIYAEAQTICEDPFILLPARAQCIQDYVSSHAAPGSDAEELEFPDKALYSYAFSSPAWSPDLAGFAVLVSFLSLLSVMLLAVTRGLLPVLNRWIDSDPLE